MKRKSSQKFKYTKKRKFLKNQDDDSTEDDEEMPPISLPDLLPKESKSKDKIFAEGNHIYFRDKVTFETIGKLINLIDEANSLYEENKNISCGFLIPKPIYLHICSPGGVLIAGLMAYDYIRSSNIPIYTVAEGEAVSAGSIMFMAGKKRFMTETGFILIHQLSGGNYGTFENLKDDFENDSLLMLKIKNIYMKNLIKNKDTKSSLLTEEELEQVLTHDIYWDFDTCFKKGFVNEKYTNFKDRDVKDMNEILKNMNDYKTYINT